MYKFAINRPIATLMLFLALVLFGAYSIKNMSVDLFPSVDIPIVKITTYAKGDRGYIEAKISKKIEDEVSQIDGIKKIYSKSYDNLSVVVVEFALDKDINVAANDVRDQVAKAHISANSEVEKISGANSPIFSIFIKSNTNNKLALMQKIDSFAKDYLQKIDGVGRVKSVGFSQPEARIYLNPKRLDELSLSADKIASIIKSQNLKIPLGDIKSSSTLMSLKSEFDAKNIDELGKIRIMPGLFLSDIADVRLDTADEQSLAIMDGYDGVLLEIIKVRGGNSLKTIENIKSKLDEFNALLGDDFSSSVAYDKSELIKKHLNQVIFDMVLGIFLTIIIVFVFLRSFSATFISALAIPASIISTFFIIDVLGFDINRLTLVALTLSIGIFVDDAIVVIEHISNKLKTEQNALKASFSGVREIAFSVLAVSAVLLCVFVPIAFMDGIVGRYFNSFAMSVAGGVVVSFLVCVMLVPSLAARFFNPPKSPFYLRTEAIFERIEEAYASLLATILKFKLTFIFISLGALFLCMSLALRVGNDFMPAEDNSEFIIFVKAKPSISLEAMKDELKPAQEFIRQDSRVDYSYTLIGYDDAHEAYKAKIYLKLLPLSKRKKRQNQIQDEYRQKLKIKDAQISVVPLPVVDSSDMTEPVQLVITGDSLKVLDDLSPKIRAMLAGINGVVDITSSNDDKSAQVKISLDKEALKHMGLSEYEVSSAIQAAFSTQVVGTMDSDKSELDITMRFGDEFKSQLKDLAQLQLYIPSGMRLSLGDVASFSVELSSTSISRFNKQRELKYTSNVNSIPLGVVQSEVDKILPQILPVGYSYRFTGFVELMNDTNKAFVFTVLLSVVLVYMILAALYESFLLPIVVMMSMPLAFGGVAVGLFLSGNSFSLFVMVAAILLFGMVGKNAILVVDFANKFARSGMDINKAIIAAGKSRLRAILMTTMAMIFAMLPLALSHGAGYEGNSPMAITVISGLISSTALTLLIVPAMFGAVFRADRWLRKFYEKDELK
ncbi:efflux RND transporter permease subunit [Campylobacter sp. 19-13652]|uniref:efflux RND transporter permease subunit n=1 Tax=Campylobacter sp. 19-13652 TaxID=2840180 RepID=UPI001C74EAA4|nr:efflux RND transporter permease subunit [Campylobacter sp. 19-13652]BCX79450.1 multidrug transporter [Campylobacter sp. 19-13652]